MLFSYRLSIGELTFVDKTNILQGTLDLLILKALTLDLMHGLGIA